MFINQNQEKSSLRDLIDTVSDRPNGIDCTGLTGASAAYLVSRLFSEQRVSILLMVPSPKAAEAMRENLSHLRPINLAPISVKTCVDTAFKATTLPPGISIQVETLEDLPAVVAGKRSLTLVFINLLENAADAMGGNGTVYIQGQAINNWVEIVVGDSGPGIAPELHDRIFEFNFSGRGSARPGKLGFGLWWVKTLMARLGGSVAVESDGRHGTVFRLKLPRAEGIS